MTFSSFDEHLTPLFRLLAIMKLSDLVTFHIVLFMHKLQKQVINYLPILIASLIQHLVSITTIHEVQQINLITCLELEQITEYLIFAFKDQRYVIPALGKDIKSTPFGKFKKQLKNELLCQY